MFELSYDESLELLKNAEAPSNTELIEQLSTGIEFITDFWQEKYLNQYLAQGGSKIKFVTGGNGSGKTHLLQLFSMNAKKSNYITADFSANDIWLHDFKDVYVEILKKTEFISKLKSCATKIIIALGYDPSLIGDNVTFVDYLSNRGELDPITKREIRIQLQEMFLNNPLIDNNFALACSLLTGSILGHPALENQNKELLLSWLMAEKGVKLNLVRKLGLSPSKITKFNARHMLRSLCEVIKISGHKGIIVTIDNLEALITKNSMNEVNYTRLKRDDAYESMRELIDEIDTMKNIMFVYAFDRELIDNHSAGLKSYIALWNRIQNEIVNNRFNRFTDMIDLELFMNQVFTKETLIEMSQKLADVMNIFGGTIEPIQEFEALEILSRVKLTKICLPRLVNIATLRKGGFYRD